MIAGILFWTSLLFILYVYIGYPLLVALFSIFRKPDSFQVGKLPLISMIFSAYNEEKVIAQKLENCLSLEYPRQLLQVIVADDGSTDQTSNIISRYLDQGIVLAGFKVRRGKLSAIKDAMKLAKGEIILFSDSDNLYASGTLNELVKPFSNPKVGAVSGGRNVLGRTNLGESEGLYWRYEEFIKKHESRLGSCIGVAGDLLAIRRSLFVPPPDGIINDDFYMALNILKQGYRVVFVPAARSSHPVAGSEHEEMERRTRMVAGRYQAIFSSWKLLPYKNPVLVWQIISHKYLRPLVPLAMVLAFLASIISLFPAGKPPANSVLWLGFPFNWFILLLQILFYILAGVGMKIKFAGSLGKALYIPTFLVNSNLSALLGLFRFMTSKQTVTWNKVNR